MNEDVARWRCGQGKRLRRMLPPHNTILPTRRTRVFLSTCHLDHDPQNDAAGNLAALCQRCHLLNDAPEHRRRRAVTVRARRALGGPVHGAISPLKVDPFSGDDAMDQREIILSVETALECSVYHAPYSMGLTFDELVEIGDRLSIRKGELSDAIMRQGLNRNSKNRYELGPILGHKLMISGVLNPDFRPLDEMEFIHNQLKELARDVGVDNARIARDVLVVRAAKEGMSQNRMDVAIVIGTLCNRLSEEGGNVSFVKSAAVGMSPKEMERQHGIGSRGAIPIRKKVNDLVADVISRRTDGRPKSVDVQIEFANQLEMLGYKPFRLWWMQILAEMRSTNDNSSSVAVTVLAASLMEGALTFVVRHARSLNLGLFASDTWDRPPNTWRIEDLVKSASGSGPHAILDQGSKVRAEALIRSRQRIHAGRMLVDHPTGVPDVRPEEAREARSILEAVLRKILDWIEQHPKL